MKKQTLSDEEIEEIFKDIEKYSRKLNDLIFISTGGKAHQIWKFALIIMLGKRLEEYLIKKIGKSDLNGTLKILEKRFGFVKKEDLK